MAAALGLPILQPAKVRRPKNWTRIAELSPDLIVVMAYGQILPKKLLEMPTLACLNLHASLLPRHRGAAPIQASILAGDRSTGLTVMYMAEGLDTGDILLTRSIAHSEAGDWRIAARSPGYPRTGRALLRRWNLILVRQSSRIPQDESQATYAAKLERESGRIDWSQDCWHLDRLVRAMNPWPGSFTLVRNHENAVQKLKVHRALPIHRVSGEAGAVLRVGDRGILVACGEGGLLLLEVQLEGKRRMSGAEFVRGFALPVGTVLGS